MRTNSLAMSIFQPQQVLKDRYRIDASLTPGGFGLTYQAFDLKNNQPVAIKTLNRNLHGDRPNWDDMQEKFVNEAMVLATLQHPHIVKVYPQLFQVDGLWCMVMEYVEGKSLTQILQSGLLEEREALRIIEQIGQALHHIHTCQDSVILHRDVTPNNIMVRSSNQDAVLIDFGLAREVSINAIHSLTNVGTEGFKAPEQYKRRDNFTPALDVYALAATLYTLLSGQMIVPGHYREEHNIPVKPVHELNPKIRPSISEAIIQGTAIKVDERPQTIIEWLKLLKLETSNFYVEEVHNIDINFLKSRETFNKTGISPEDDLISIDLDPEPLQDIEAHPAVERFNKFLADLDRGIIPNPTTADTENRQTSNTKEFFFETGKSLFDQGQYKEAISNFDRAINIDSTYTVAYGWRGGSYIALQDYQTGLADLDKAIEMGLDTNTVFKYKGLAHHCLGDWEEALRQYNIALKISPSDPQTYTWQAYSLERLGKYDEAISKADQAINLDKSYAEAYGVRCSICINKQNELIAKYGYKDLNLYQQVINDATIAIRLAPNDPNCDVRYHNRGLAYQNLKRYKDAISDFSEALQLNPQNVFSYQHRGETYTFLKEYPKALDDLSKAIRINPSESNSYALRAKILEEKSEFFKALEDYDQAIQLSLDPSKKSYYYYQKGFLLRKIGRYHEALNAQEKAVLLAPNHPFSYNNRGQAYGDLKQYEEAIADYSKSIELNNPELHNPYNGRALVYNSMGQYELAMQDANKSLELKAEANTYNTRAIIYSNLKKYSEAIADATKAIEVEPISVAYNTRGAAYYQLSQYAEAIADYENAIKLDPSYVQAFKNLANAYRKIYSHSLNSEYLGLALENFSKAEALYRKFGDKANAEKMADEIREIKTSSPRVRAWHRENT